MTKSNIRKRQKGLSNPRRKILKQLGLGSILFGAAKVATSANPILGDFSSQTGKQTWDPYSFGAKGDGKTIETKAIPTTRDRCSETGRGTVDLRSGWFISGSLYIKNNVRLYIDSGTVLQGSDNLDDCD